MVNHFTEHNIHFLNESNRIEDIKEIDYHNRAYQKTDKGHFGAFILSQESALKKEPLTIKMIRTWQRLITKEQLPLGYHLEDSAVGHIRNPNNPVNVRIGKHIPPSFNDVPTHLDALVEKINDALKNREQFADDKAFCQFLGASFQRYEWIHPFADGNGRSGRLLAGYIATFCDRPIIVFESEMIERNRYYAAHDSEEKMAAFMESKLTSR